MAMYLAMRIRQGELDYNTVVSSRPDLKAEIDALLKVA